MEKCPTSAIPELKQPRMGRIEAGAFHPKGIGLTIKKSFRSDLT